MVWYAAGNPACPGRSVSTNPGGTALPAAHQGRDGRQIQSGGEVVTERVQHPTRSAGSSSSRGRFPPSSRNMRGVKPLRLAGRLMPISSSGATAFGNDRAFGEVFAPHAKWAAPAPWHHVGDSSES